MLELCDKAEGFALQCLIRDRNIPFIMAFAEASVHVTCPHYTFDDSTTATATTTSTTADILNNS